MERLGFATKVVADFSSAQRTLDRRGEKPIVIVPEIGVESASADQVVEFAEAEGGEVFVVYIADTISAEMYKRLVRTGTGEWIKWETVARELVDVVRRAHHREIGGSAKVVSFLPSKGGVGNTTIALECGVHLSAARKRSQNDRLAVLDLNFQGGTLAEALDLEPRFDVTEIMHRPERLDDQLIDIFTSRFSSGLDIFSSPTRFMQGEDVDPRIIYALLDALGRRYSSVLVDLPQHWLPWIDNVLQGSDAVVITGTSTVPGVKRMISCIQHIDEIKVPPERVSLAVNTCATDLFGRVSRRSELESTFKGRNVIYIPSDRVAVDALNSGQPISAVAPRKSITKSLQGLAGWIEKVLDQPTKNTDV